MADPQPQPPQPDPNPPSWLSLFGQGNGADAQDAQDTADAYAFNKSPSVMDQQVRTGIDFNNGEWSYANGQPVDQVSMLDALRNLTIMSPDELQKLQRQMYDAGLYPDSYYNKGGPQIHYGALDDATISAYKTAAMGAYRSNGQFTIQDVINRGAAAGYGQQQSQATIKPLVITLTPADQIKGNAEAVAEKTIGHKLSDQQLQWLVDSFHAMEATAQQQEYQAGINPGTGDATMGSGGTITKSPTLDANYLAYMLRQQDPAEAQAQDTSNQLDVVNQMLHGQI